MTSAGSPCGACKFLRRKCVTGCVFAPYFCHEQGSAHFAAIHKVFGASNVSKLLSHLPVTDRCEAAVTISYEAQARLQDPIYGCVSHIFSLQQQVVRLQAQLASLKEFQAGQSFTNSSGTVSPNYGKFFPRQEDLDLCGPFLGFESSPYTFQQMMNNTTTSNSENEALNKQNHHYPEYSLIHPNQNSSHGVFEGVNSFSTSSFEMQSIDNTQWHFKDFSDLPSITFG